MSRAALVLSLALASFSPLLAAEAHADAVEAPPDACPAGSTPSSAHTGPYCRAAIACASDAECTGGATCQEIAQCIETRPCGGLSSADAAPCTVSHVSGLCSAERACATGTCESRRVCLAPGTDTTPGGGGCSCRVGPRPASGAVAALALGALGLATRRRRRRP